MLKKSFATLLTITTLSSAHIQAQEIQTLPKSAIQQKIETVSSISAELQSLKNLLIESQKEKTSRTIKIVISATAGMALAGVTHHILKTGDLYTLGFGFVAGAGSAASLTYLGYQGWQLVLTNQQIDQVTSQIDLKTKELAIAKKTLEDVLN